ncbi:MAG: transposase [Bacteroidetes bacterium]|nr:transposase [Bacteroidota bacterium]
MSKKGKFTSGKKSKLRIQRIFSDTFKKARVKEIDDGLVSVTELSKLYNVSKQSIYRWLHKYSINHQKGVKQVVQMESESQRTQALLKRISELERIVGQKQIELEYMDKLVEISSKELKIDLKKNFDTRFSTTSTGSSSKKVLR